MTRGPEWVKEERKFGLNNKTPADAIAAIKEAAKGLDEAKVVVSSGGYHSRSRSGIFVVGWRKKSADELAAEQKTAEDLATAKAEKAVRAAELKAKRAVEAKERAKKRAAEARDQAARESARRAKELVKDVEAMKKLLRSVGYEVKKS
jgi:hypothetical protein